MKKEVRVAFYTRVSTLDQSINGYGLEYQLQALNDLMSFKKNQDTPWVKYKHYEENGCSGSSLERPAYQRMMEDAKKDKFDMVVVWKIDRMSRNLSDLLQIFEDLKKYNVGFYSIKENMDFTCSI